MINDLLGKGKQMIKDLLGKGKQMIKDLLGKGKIIQLADDEGNDVSFPTKLNSKGRSIKLSDDEGASRKGEEIQLD